MKRYLVRLFAEQPLSLDDATQVSAGAVRGMFGAAALQSCVPGAAHESGPCNANCIYWPLFGKHALHVADAHATTSDALTLLPLTARTCAALPGPRGEGGHGFFDIAIKAWLYQEALALGATIYAPFEQRCPVCGAALIQPAQPFIQKPDGAFATCSVKIEQSAAQHGQLTRRSGPVHATFEQRGVRLAEGAYYLTRVSVADANDLQFRALVFRDLYLGGRRTRGMGKVRAEAIPLPDESATLRERISTFNRTLRLETRFYAAMHGVEYRVDPDGTWYFTLDSTEGISFDMPPFAEFKTLQGAKLLHRWLAPFTRSGRSAGMPTRTRQLWRATFLCSAPPEADRAGLEQALLYLEAQGMGAARDRDSGTVRVCDPFHLEMEPK